MPNIPAKITERFVKNIDRFQKVLRLAKDRDINESDTVSVLTDILTEVFGYDKYLEITSEFAIRGTYCDLAVKIDGKVQFLIEVKAIGIELKESHVKQAIDYGANHGIQWIILTNGIEWRLYRIRFEQPINFDLVCSFDFLTIKPKTERDQEYLFILSKEGLGKKAREELYEKVQSINRYIIGHLIVSEPTLATIRRELRKLADGMKVEVGEIEDIVRNQILKREILEGEEAEIANKRVSKFYKKNSITRSRNNTKDKPTSDAAQPKESVTEQLLRESQEQL